MRKDFGVGDWGFSVSVFQCFISMLIGFGTWDLDFGTWNMKLLPSTSEKIIPLMHKN